MSTRVLHLTLKKKWFDMIEAGEKKEEYREVKAYWLNRIKTADQFTHVSFTHGYARDARRMVFEIKNISCREGRPEWGADPGRMHFVIELGERKPLFFYEPKGGKK